MGGGERVAVWCRGVVAVIDGAAIIEAGQSAGLSRVASREFPQPINGSIFPTTPFLCQFGPGASRKLTVVYNDHRIELYDHSVERFLQMLLSGASINVSLLLMVRKLVSTTSNNRLALYIIMIVATIIAALIVEYVVTEDPNTAYAIIMGLATGLAADIAHYIATRRNRGTTTNRTAD